MKLDLLTSLGFVASSLIVTVCGAAAPANEDLIWFDQPAAYFTESSPIANGRLAAMVFGGTTDERVVLNEASMWSGSAQDGGRPADVYKELPEIQRLLLAGKVVEAEKLLVDRFLTKPMPVEKVVIPPGHAPGTGSVTKFGCFQVLGNLWLNFDLPNRTAVTDYRRELDMATALVKVDFNSGGVHFTRESFASAPDDVIMMRFTADKPGMISFRAHLDRPEKATTVADGPNGLLMTGQLQNGVDGKGLRFAARVHAVSRGGVVYTKENMLVVRKADEVTLYVTGLTNAPTFASRFAEDPPATTLADLKRVAAKAYAAVKKAHVDDHARWYNRMSLRLGGGDSPASSKPTPARILALDQGANDPGLAALFFNFGRYALITTSRPGGLPPNLQGLWAEEIQTAWNGDWHLDINLQMNYWAANVCNLAELNQPLFKMIEAYQVPGGKTAKQYYNARGWVIHTFTNPWGFTAPGWSPGWGVFHAATAWLCQHVWDNYQFTQDREYLKWAYPILKGAGEFYLDTLVEEPKTKWLVTAPSHSPENPYELPNGAKVSACVAATGDMQMIRHLFTGCIEASQILGVDEGLRAEWTTARGRLVPTRVAPDDGRIMEWFEDFKDVDPQHRHMTPLWGAYPGAEITTGKTPELVEAAKKTLAIRDLDTLPGRGEKGPAWGIVMRTGIWARFKDADRCGKFVKTMLRPVSAEVTSQRELSGVYPNLFASGPPFQIDANLGAPGVMAEMLMQSYTGEIELLPALPRDWPEGSVERLQARGGFEVDITWKAGRLVEATVRRKAGVSGPCRVRHGNKVVTLDIPLGGAVRLDGNLAVMAQ